MMDPVPINSPYKENILGSLNQIQFMRMNLHLQEVFENTRPFDGISIGLIGDFHQVLNLVGVL